MSATCLKSKFTLLLLLSSLLFAPGCSGLFSNDGNSNNLDDTCTKDIDELNALLGVGGQQCTTTAECPVGSFCNSQTSYCDFDCYADSDCGIGMGCTCEGQCAAESGPDAGPIDPNTDPSCERSTPLLESIHTPPTDCSVDACPTGAECDQASQTCKSLTPRACTFDDQCPLGARCDSGTLTCVWDCLSTDDADFGCGANTVCDCYGKCVDPADNTPRSNAQLPRLSLYPSNIPILPPQDPDTGWAPRRINIALITDSQTVAAASTGTVVNVAAGDDLEVNCDPLARETGPYTASCAVSVWSFNNGNGDFVGRADHFIWVRPAASFFPRDPAVTSWDVQVSSAGATDSPEIISIEQTEAPIVSNVDRDGEYTGYVELVRAGDFEHSYPDDPVPLRVPVRAFVTDTSIDLVDDLGVLSENGKLRLNDGNYTFSTFFKPVDQGPQVPADAVGEFPHYAGSMVAPTADAQAATLTGTFLTAGIAANGYASLNWRFTLVRIGDRVACQADTDCATGEFCDMDLFVGDPSFGGCTGGAPWEPANFLSLVEFDHKKSERWKRAISDLFPLAVWNPAPEVDAQFPSLYLPYLYDRVAGMASDSLAGHRRIVGADLLVAAADGDGAGKVLCNRDFLPYLDSLAAEISGWSVEFHDQIGGGHFTTPFPTDVCSWLYGDVPLVGVVACIEPGGQYDQYVGQAGSCAKVYENHRRAQAPLTTPVADLAGFLANDCTFTPHLIHLSNGSINEYNAVYLCPHRQALLGSLNPAALAENMLCYEPGTGQLLFETASFGQTALAKSGDLACSDGRVPVGVDLVTHADRVARGQATPVRAGDMLARCLADLQVEQSPLSTRFDLATASQHIENLFAHDACFSAANFYGALDAVTSGNWVQADLEGDPRIPTLYMRLLQQWLELHGYVAKQGQQQQGLADVLASRSDLDVNESDAVSQAPGFEALLDQMEKGWNLVLSQDHFNRLLAVPAANVLAPDYRAAFTGTPPAAQPHHEQSVGLPVTMIETASLHLQLLEAYLQDALNRSYADCFFGANTGGAQLASDRAGRTMRYLLTAEMIASTIRDRATAVPCGTGCDAGLTCNNQNFCELSDGTWQRAPHAWSDRWDNSLVEFHSIRARTTDALRALQACVNPIEIAEQQVPLYFGDPVGDTGRFFASSDYLLNGWAIPAMQGAEFSLTEARTSWLSARNSEIQQTQTQQDADRRLENVSAQYGRTIVDACGLVTVEAKDALALVADGTISPDSCYFNPQNDPTCLPPPPLHAQVTNEIARFQLCMWDHVKSNLGGPPTTTVLGIEVPTRLQQYFALISALVQLGDAPADYVNASVAENPVDSSLFKVSAGSMVLPVSDLFGIATTAAGALPDAVVNARSFCANLSVFGGTEHPLPQDTQSMADVTSMAHCYQGQLGEAAIGVLIGAKEIEIALARWDELARRIENENGMCLVLGVDLSKRQAMSDAHTAYMAKQAELRQKAEKSSSKWRSLSSGIGAALSAAGAAGAGNWATVVVVVAGAIPGQVADDKARTASRIAADMELASLAFENALRQIDGEIALKDCYHGVKQLREGIQTTALQIEQASLSADVSLVRFVNLQRSVAQAFLEGQAAVAREAGRTVPSVAHHYWLSEKIDRFQKDFKWAKQLTFLAMKAVEYEFQQTLSVREDIVTAVHPGQLEDAVRVLQQEQFTRTINSRRPEQDILVLSLRDQIMRVADNSSSEPGERDWSPDIRFQQRLWSDDYAIRDDDGNYLGQGIPFTLEPVGPLPHRCAERLWSMTATIQGDLLGNRAPGAPVFIIRRNQFASQWCDGRGDDSSYQVASLQPASQLFHPENRGGSEAAKLSHITAMLYPWFNIPRSEFYREAYVEGASDELAGRGLYGDYIILFPYHGLLEDGFPLEQIEDVLIRFDYLSVDNITGL